MLAMPFLIGEVIGGLVVLKSKKIEDAKAAQKKQS
jgi:hypothetical protein